MSAFTYCGLLQLKDTDTQLSSLSSFHSYTLKIVSRDVRPNQQATTVVNANKTRACKMVRKCLDKQTCEQLQIHFTLQYHERHTRNDNHTVKIARIKTEFARKSFMFMDANVYNELPLELRKVENYKEFEKQLKEHFKWHLFWNYIGNFEFKQYISLFFLFITIKIFNCKHWGLGHRTHIDNSSFYLLKCISCINIRLVIIIIYYYVFPCCWKFHELHQGMAHRKEEDPKW